MKSVPDYVVAIAVQYVLICEKPLMSSNLRLLRNMDYVFKPQV